MKMVTEDRINKIKWVLDRRQPDLILVVDNVVNAHNFSALLRTADAAGVLYVHAIIPPDSSVSISKAVTQGAYRWLVIEKHREPRSCLRKLKEKGLQLVVTTLEGENILNHWQVDFTKPTAIVMGNERKGVSEASIEMADVKVKIPMFGMSQSLNVSVAFGIIVYEALRQRIKAGFFERIPFLEKNLYSAIFSEWLGDSTPSLPEVARLFVSDAKKYLNSRNRLGWLVVVQGVSQDRLLEVFKPFVPVFALNFKNCVVAFFIHVKRKFDQFILEKLQFLQQTQPQMLWFHLERVEI